ncbi:MAG: dipeptidase [Candidatus Xiphinematobacter sp.]|nr:MAG: dipeptidase [Candidatus Xiphinematobacter sp.]QQY09982.1 MAG: dipeptidase [Candidatus Xiphinematobacter sp.]QQY10715.1 MAG: dipeptidase [Candidatus Xiphinematobacter sp.]
MCLNDSFLHDLMEFLSIPSISAQPAYHNDVYRCAKWLEARLRRAGLRTSTPSTPGYPVIVGKSRDWQNCKPTVLIYGHYDVQPPEPFEEWISPPFEPAIRDGKVYGRGSTDNKGQILAHVLGVHEALQVDGSLPCNVIFLIEGEEEIGSPHLPSFLEDHKRELGTDIIIISDTGMVGEGIPTLSYSIRGVAALELIVYGPSHDLHSGMYGGAVVNPATVAARLIASLHDVSWRVTIPGFYDDVRDPEPWEREITFSIPDSEIIARTGASELHGESGYTSGERIGARPTVEVNGIGSGYQGEGTKTVLPRKAVAKLTFRLVPDQNPDKILSLAEAYLRAQCPKGVHLEIRIGHSSPAYFFNPNSTYGQVAQAALQKTFGRRSVLIREGGSIPIVQNFKTVLGVDSLLLALASPDCRAHSPNENFSIENFQSGIRLNQVFLREVAELPFRGDIPRDSGGIEGAYVVC